MFTPDGEYFEKVNPDKKLVVGIDEDRVLEVDHIGSGVIPVQATNHEIQPTRSCLFWVN
jgi:hypothetical protein